MNFDLNSEEFWDPEATRREVMRVFDVCNGCRVCESFCPSFVNLFEWTDENFGDVDELKEEQVDEVIRLCYQCKLCFPVCPYVPPDEFDIDFPRTMMRANLVQAKEKGTSFADRMMGDTDWVGSMASLAAPLVNWANRNPTLRGFLENFMGVHKDRLLPDFHSKTFAKWFRGRGAQPPAENGGSEEKVALFYTCTVNYNEPEIGKATVGVLEKNGVEFQVPEQQCCGLPLLDVGLVDRAMKKIESNVAVFSEAIRQGYKIVVPSASCSYMLKKDYPELLPTEDAKLVADNTYDLSEYLVKVHKSGKLNQDFSQDVGKIRYHQPCHLKAQNMGFKAQELLKVIPGVEVARMQCCSGHDGTWSVKKENFEASMEVGRPLFKFMKADEEACTVTDCPLSAIQIEQGTGGQRPVHPVVVLAKAYGLDL